MRQGGVEGKEGETPHVSNEDERQRTTNNDNKRLGDNQRQQRLLLLRLVAGRD